MSLLSWAQWLDGSALGTAIRDSSTLFPIVETFHLLALSVLGGAILIVDLRLCGFGTRQPLTEVAKDAQPWLLGSLAVMAASGILLFPEVLKGWQRSGPPQDDRWSSRCCSPHGATGDDVRGGVRYIGAA
jgi:hypothetical protein